MASVIVTTDAGRVVWRMDGIRSTEIGGLEARGNRVGSSLASGIRRAVRDAEYMAAGRDPERPSEKAMRLSEQQRRAAQADPRGEADR